MADGRLLLRPRRPSHWHRGGERAAARALDPARPPHGGGPLLAQAIEDLAALPPDAHERAVAEQILLHLQHALGKKPSRTPEEQEFVMAMQNTWEKARDDGRREGWDEGRKQGWDQGRKEGKDEGGRAHARAMLRRVLSMRQLVPSRQDEAHIDSCDDLATLDRWIEQAMVAQSVAEALGVNGTAATRRAAPRRGRTPV